MMSERPQTKSGHARYSVGTPNECSSWNEEMDSIALGWRYFKPEEIREALMWAGKGGVTVFEAPMPFHSLPSARLLARDISALYAAARELGIGPEFVQAKPHVPELTHFILFAGFLDKAKQKCPVHIGPVAAPELRQGHSNTKPSAARAEQRSRERKPVRGSKRA